MQSIISQAEELFTYNQSLRRDFHQHPELGFQELRTSRIVKQELEKLGLETITGIAETGVITLIEGAKPGPVVLARFDMDALPITEENVRSLLRQKAPSSPEKPASQQRASLPGTSTVSFRSFPVPRVPHIVCADCTHRSDTLSLTWSRPCGWRRDAEGGSYAKQCAYLGRSRHSSPRRSKHGRLPRGERIHRIDGRPSTRGLATLRCDQS